MGGKGDAGMDMTDYERGRRKGLTGQERNDSAGQGRAGQGRAGQGRAGQGRAGQGREEAREEVMADKEVVSMEGTVEVKHG